jgi:hypothetical protein
MLIQRSRISELINSDTATTTDAAYPNHSTEFCMPAV